MFIDAANGDYRVSAGSPAIDAAEMDLFDGEFALASFFDANNDFRLVDDPAMTDTGTGERSFLDIGAFEYQPPECPADQNFDGMLSPTDFTAWINNYNNGCP